MKPLYINNVYAGLAMLALAACSDHWDDFTPVHDERTDSATAPTPAEAIAFVASVSPSQTAIETTDAKNRTGQEPLATRADGSLINRLETALFKTEDRSYWAWDNETGTAKETKRQYSVGLFGAYTGTADWDGTQSANFLFNQKMDIAAAVGNQNVLSYHRDETDTYADSLVRFWPNNHDGSGHYEKVSFWGYYPWNATDDPGEYGISIVSSPTAAGTQTYGITTDNGMGSVRFTMHPDASEQSDFMLSSLVANGSKDLYPLQSDGVPTPVTLQLHHMLAQVRMYAFIRGTDKVVWAKKDGKTLKVKAYEGTTLTLTDGTNDYSCTDVATNQWVDPWGVTRTLAAGDSVPDDWPFLNGAVAVASPKTVRWQRGETLDVTGRRYRTTATYTMSFNNIHTSAIFTPTYDPATRKTTFAYTDVGTLGSATVNHYIMNPYWFRWNAKGERVMLNETYMYNYFEGTPAYGDGTTAGSANDLSGYTWSTFAGVGKATGASNVMGYTLASENEEPDNARGHKGRHFNYPPGNIIMAVPQVMRDNDVPHVVLTGTGKQVTYSWNASSSRFEPTVVTDGKGKDVAVVGRVTINMLNMNLKWESGFIYSYAFLEDDLQPGDDKVKGPESISTVFDPSRWTDQW